MSVSFVLKQMRCLMSRCLEWDNKEVSPSGWSQSMVGGIKMLVPLCDVTMAHNAAKPKTDFWRENWANIY